jgi:hypothetical protein
MKKSLIALAALAAFGTASAQSTVTISGTFGAAQQSFQTSGVSTNGLTMTDSSIKFTAVEDLGGGLKANAAVQFAANEIRGSNGQMTKEDSSVGLSGGFGSLSIANTRSGNAAIGAFVFASWMPKNFYNATVEATRIDTDNLIYVSPQLAPGLTVGYQMVEATEGTSTTSIKINAYTANYANGPLSATITFKDYNAAGETAGSKDRTEGAVTYDLGMAKVGVGFGTKRTSSDENLVTVGVSVPLGAVTAGVNYATRGDIGNFYEAGVNYALSKRTSVQAMIGNITAGTSGTTFYGSQYRVGVVHTF